MCPIVEIYTKYSRVLEYVFQYIFVLRRIIKITDIFKGITKVFAYSLTNWAIFSVPILQLFNIYDIVTYVQFYRYFSSSFEPLEKNVAHFFLSKVFVAIVAITIVLYPIEFIR